MQKQHRDIRNSVKIRINLSGHFHVTHVTKFSCTSQNLKDTSQYILKKILFEKIVVNHSKEKTIL